MKFEQPLLKGTLLRRYKRFLADVCLETGEELTVHCPNPGAMAGLKDAGNKVWISDSQNPARKLRYTWELVEAKRVIIGINTNRANAIAREAIESGMLPSLKPTASIKPEQKYGTNSRIDFLIEEAGKPPTFLEVKNVTFQRQSGLHEFPDGVTARGTKHLNELVNEVEKGNRAIMLYVIQRNDGDQFSIAEDIDKAYGRTFRKAIAKGLEAYAICCDMTPEEIKPQRLVNVIM